MPDFYVLKSLSNAEEFIKLDVNISKNEKDACKKSEFQFLTHDTINSEISEEGGLKIPDFIYQDGLFFISNRVKTFLCENKCDYLYFKRVNVVSEKFGIHEIFWIVIPPRIDCLELDESELDLNWNFYDGLIPQLNFSKIVIQKSMVGNYKIFKILGIKDNNVYITEEMYEKIQDRNFIGINFISI